MAEDCIHGMNPDWCAVCQKTDHGGIGAPRNYGYYGGQSKQDLLNNVTDQLGLPRETVGVGSSLPSTVFDAAAKRFGIAYGSMPEVGEALAIKAGRPWDADCDSRGSLSGGGSTVTAQGLEVMNKAIATLLARGL
jgi:hypothetical protein